jgi:hypothetical protein
MGVEGHRRKIKEGKMKDWKVWAIFLLVGVVLFQYAALRRVDNSYHQDVSLLRQEINKVSADALETRLHNTAFHMVQMNCAVVESSVKGWDACVIKNTSNSSEVVPVPCPADDPLGLKTSQRCAPLPPKE